MMSKLVAVAATLVGSVSGAPMAQTPALDTNNYPFYPASPLKSNCFGPYGDAAGLPLTSGDDTFMHIRGGWELRDADLIITSDLNTKTIDDFKASALLYKFPDSCFKEVVAGM